jgi:hypothetical protein
MVLAMFLRAKSRNNIQFHTIDFCHEGDRWRVVIRVARFCRLLYTQVKIVPGDLMSFRPQLAYTARKNGRPVMALPNFWANHAGVALCKVAGDDCLTMQIEIALKDLAMARAFEKNLAEMGHDAVVKHNLVIFQHIIVQKP